ncbi:ribonuclease M5 [Alicyclobacillus acidoterrestris]|uniref:ribonuclease M5 n=1 Tax=Alicyclobacillus suci TaxID=2816080 RepID=UPI0011941288|nr:ribonuclease M5 [Alicyclobacillus suci]GEO26360.1 ribonuclease M5 [Alicyclobacillus acidoterrestris]
MNEDVQRPVIHEIVVVEGIHDKQVVDVAVKADVLVLGGDRIGQRTMDVLRRAVRTRGVIVLTDPDGAGERIRRRIDRAVPGCSHAHVARRQAVNRQGLGVEHADARAVREALLRARGQVAPTRLENRVEFTQEDLLSARLLACPEASVRRMVIGDQLGIGYGNAKAFLNKLNTLGVTREEWRQALERLERDDG